MNPPAPSVVPSPALAPAGCRPLPSSQRSASSWHLCGQTAQAVSCHTGLTSSHSGCPSLCPKHTRHRQSRGAQSRAGAPSFCLSPEMVSPAPGSQCITATLHTAATLHTTHSVSLPCCTPLSVHHCQAAHHCHSASLPHCTSLSAGSMLSRTSELTKGMRWHENGGRA